MKKKKMARSSSSSSSSNKRYSSSSSNNSRSSSCEERKSKKCCLEESNENKNAIIETYCQFNSEQAEMFNQIHDPEIISQLYDEISVFVNLSEERQGFSLAATAGTASEINRYKEEYDKKQIEEQMRMLEQIKRDSKKDKNGGKNNKKEEKKRDSIKKSKEIKSLNKNKRRISQTSFKTFIQNDSKIQEYIKELKTLCMSRFTEYGDYYSMDLKIDADGLKGQTFIYSWKE